MKTLVALFIFCFLLTSPITWAKYDAYSPAAAERSAKSNQSQKALKVRSSQQAAKLVKQRYGGKVLKVSKKNVNGHSGYKVKLIKSNGHVVTIIVDAQTGRLSGN
ncbi:MAG: PepSY domain-containing protein [Alteromonadaceae bacterium]|nr:PepSY domain-containing protein [Alteromonadaceae bacterium]